MHLTVIPLTLKRANELVAEMHRHHKPVVGHRFSLGAVDKEGNIHGAVIVGRPVARELDQYTVAEVTRLVTDGTKNVCSFLYSAAARVAREMGFYTIQTYTLETEPGTSLIAAGWDLDGITAGGNWNHGKRKGRREDQPMIPKLRWKKLLHRN